LNQVKKIGRVSLIGTNSIRNGKPDTKKFYKIDGRVEDYELEPCLFVPNIRW